MTKIRSQFTNCCSRLPHIALILCSDNVNHHKFGRWSRSSKFAWQMADRLCELLILIYVKFLIKVLPLMAPVWRQKERKVQPICAYLICVMSLQASLLFLFSLGFFFVEQHVLKSSSYLFENKWKISKLWKWKQEILLFGKLFFEMN